MWAGGFDVTKLKPALNKAPEIDSAMSEKTKSYSPANKQGSTNAGNDATLDINKYAKSRADLIKASEIEASIEGHLRIAITYADIAIQHDGIHDHAGFVMSADKFVDHARDVAMKLRELRKVRGVLD